jgi:uncharacterized iron-regulated membrane protein
MRRLLFNLHLYAALIAGAFILVLGLTGSIMAFEPEIEHVLHWRLTYVKPQGRVLSLSEIRAAIEKAFPGEPIGAYGLSTAPSISYQVELNRGVVSIDQYTGKVLGVRQRSDFVNQTLNYIHQIHLRLAIRSRADPGKKIMSWAGVTMLFLLLSGLYLWWPYQRVTIQWSGWSMRTWLDIHNAVGIFSFVFLLVLATTGVVIGFEEQTTPLFYKLTRSLPSDEPDVHILAPPRANVITSDQALEIARATLPGAAPFEINVPHAKEPYYVNLRYPEDRTPGGRSRVTIDPYTAKVLFAEGSRTAPAGRRMVNANRAIHTGDIFGIPSKTILSLASLMAVMQLVSGLAMWWKRRTPPKPAERTVARS